MRNARWMRRIRVLLLAVLTLVLALGPAVAHASNGALQYSKKITVSRPCYIVVTARDKAYHTVDLLKGPTTLQGAFTMEDRNGYTVKWLVPRGKYTLNASCKMSALKIQTKAIPVMQAIKTVKWKLVAKPRSGYAESDINTLCYKFVAPGDGYFTFSCDDYALIDLYNSGFRQISDTFTRGANLCGYFALQGGKTYYLTFKRSSMSSSDKLSVKCRFRKVKNKAGTTRRRAALLKTGKVTGLIFPKANSVGWIKYKVTGEENVNYDLYLNIMASTYSDIKTDVYKNGTLLGTLSGGGTLPSYTFNGFKKGDVLLFATRTTGTYTNLYSCCYYELVKRN